MGLGAALAALLASSAAAAKNVASSSPSRGTHLVLGAPPPVAVEVDGVTLEAPAPTPPTTSPRADAQPVPVATTAGPAPTTTTTAPRPTTTTGPPTTRSTQTSTSTTKPAARVSLSPTSGPPLTQITVKGSGCLGGEAGIAIELQDPAGQGLSDDGGAAQPDGTWSIWISIPANALPGRYTIHPVCLRANSSEVLASYTPLPLVVTA